MFTGIIEEVGTIQNIQRSSDVCTVKIRASKILEDIHLGDSIAVNGICLTVTHFDHQSFMADIMNETWSRTSLKPKSSVNLERALSVNGRFGGHIVSGHIDGTGIIRSIQKDGNATWYRIETSSDILSLIVEKGSIAIDGMSLTVAKVTNRDFSVSIIPHTMEQTILKNKRVNDCVNLENDVVGKYISKLMNRPEKETITREFLLKNGF